MFCAILKIPICLQEVKKPMPSYVTYHIFAATVQRVTSDSVAHIASSYPAAYRWGSQGPDPLALYHAPVPVRAAQTGEPRLHRTARAAVRVTVQSRRCVAQHGCTRVCIWILHALCAQPRNLFVCFRTGGQAVAVHAGLLCRGTPPFSRERHRRCDDRDFVSDTPAEYEAYPSAGAGCARVPSRGENSGAGPAGDVWRAHHACLPFTTR